MLTCDHKAWWVWVWIGNSCVQGGTKAHSLYDCRRLLSCEAFIDLSYYRWNMLKPLQQLCM